MRNFTFCTYSSLNIIRKIKSRRTWWTEYVARMGEKRKMFWWEIPNERDHLEDKGIDGRRGSEWLLGRLARGM
jgi:hypothetical protein